MFKRALFMLVLMLFSSVFAQNVQINFYSNGSNGSYSVPDNCYYRNPPRPSLMTNGKYVILTSGVRYVHSPSKSKRASHAARINEYNSMYY